MLVGVIIVITTCRHVMRARSVARYDKALEDYKQRMLDIGNYRDESGYITSISVDPEFSRFASKDYGTQYTDVTFTGHMSPAFDKLPVGNQCAILYKILNDIEKAYKKTRSESELIALHGGDGISQKSVRVGGIYIAERGRCTIRFEGDREYAFIGSHFYIDNTGYDYKINLSRNEVESVSAIIEKHKSNSSAEKSAALDKSIGTDKFSPGKRSRGKTRDLYHVEDYSSSQDFADDKYEEFYDYEDDYEDEDEAYDAAEDYWREHHSD